MKQIFSCIILQIIVNIVFTDCRNAFGLICKSTLDTKGTSSKLYSFMVDSEETTKKEFVTSVGKSIVNLNCVSDYVCLI